ncbi:hypothetical protein [Bauldia sp.]|uniref:hypothetical protein n=1 Tax=Bauldia sp. TaxID=2575872 RepID=UPI003BAC6C8D
MRRVFAQVIDNEVVNRIVVRGDLPEDWPDRDQWMPADDTMQIGARREMDGVFTMPVKSRDPQRDAEAAEERDRAMLMEAMLEDFARHRAGDGTADAAVRSAATRHVTRRVNERSP